MYAHLPFEILTLIFILSPALMGWIAIKKNWSRLTTISFILSVSFAITVIYGSFIEPKQLVITEYTHPGPNLGLKIAFITDLHFGPYKKASDLQPAIAKLRELQPDLILLGGDYIYRSDKYINELEGLKPLPQIAPTYGVMGNHEYDINFYSRKPDETQANNIKESLENLGIQILVDTNTSIEINHKTLNLVGINDIFHPDTNIDQAFANLPLTTPTIVLAHNPDTALYTKNYQYDLMLSGHTHGGQIRLPGIGPLVGVPTELGKKFDKGLFTINDNQVFISSGLGESGPRARLFTPPEIVMITF